MPFAHGADEGVLKNPRYLTTTEWRESFGGCKDGSISLQPFEYPVCSLNGNIYDIANVVPFLKKFGRDPVTGEKCDSKSLITLRFHKNRENAYHCPVTYRVFTNTSHVVAIRQTGNVYSYEAVEELNLKSKNFRDLLTDDPFARRDIITIQEKLMTFKDPHNLDKFNISTFYHIKKKLKVDTDEVTDVDGSERSTVKSMNTETRETLAQLDKDYKRQQTIVEIKPKADSVNAAHFSTGKVAAGFTSTVMEPITRHEAAIIDESELKYRRVSKKGYVRLVTNFGQLNFELHCDMTPKTCDNFIKHCKTGYYKNTKFHRSIKNFMIQGGDPTGTGLGGESAFGAPFEDEIKQQLRHEGRGILSMANKGTKTNTSQFFITYRSCKHLDNKHTIFGRLVGGFETLNSMERILTDDRDKPIEDIEIVDTQVFVDPFEEAEEQLVQEREKANRNESSNNQEKNKSKNIVDAKLKEYKAGVGKYVKTSAAIRYNRETSNHEQMLQTKKMKTSGVNFEDFSKW
uniref:RING-type E3 ubiquitin-protein ligase PPIL2 n=1 Tax=Romanomermis culicivorax TaxID=13658 RepID=A0A915KPW1_ROMCU